VVSICSFNILAWIRRTDPGSGCQIVFHRRECKLLHFISICCDIKHRCQTRLVAMCCTVRPSV
jgi:hypothetical protein